MLVFALLPSLPASAQATVLFEVNSTEDQGDGDLTDDECDTEDPEGECTLRAAVEQANASTDEDVIISLPADTYVLETGSPLPIDSTPSSVSIQGDGADSTIIDGDSDTRIFEVMEDADLSLDGVTLTRAAALEDEGGAILNEGEVIITSSVFADNTADGPGGAIMNEGTLNVGDTTFERNASTDSYGGAIATTQELVVTDSTFRANVAASESGAIDNDGGTAEISGSTFIDNTADTGGAVANIDLDDVMTIDTSTFTDNSATAEGGAVANFGDLTITSSTVADNIAGDRSDPGGDMDGGGIWNGGDDLALTDTVVDGNIAADEGGGVFNTSAALDTVEFRAVTISSNEAADGAGYWTEQGLTLMTNVTISGNAASGEGGGLYTGSAATLRLSHVTVARNTAGVAGGGIDHDETDVTEMVVGHTLIAENEPDNCTGDPFVSDGHNVADDGTCEGLSDAAGDETDVADARISDLGDHGGATPVHALLPDSPAIDVAETGDTDEECEDAEGGTLEEDQRGAPRPVDGDDTGTAFCDAGAFEFVGPTAIELAPADATNDVGTEHTVTATVTDSEGAAVQDIDVRFSSDGANDASGSGVTDANGEAAFSYTGDAAGEDTIAAFADTDGDEVHDEGEPSATATKTWREDAEPTTRLGGIDRFRTAIAVSQDSYADGAASAVVLARDDVFADALAGTPFSVAEDAPLLLTQTSQLRDEVADEIQRVSPDGSTVFLLGGEEALSETVADQVADLGYDVVRVYGADRFGTAVQIAGELGDPDTLMVTTGFDFVDAFTAGPAAVTADAAILLTHGDTMTPTTQSYLDDRDGEFLYAVGGPDVNPYADSDEADESVYGGDRFETAVAVADGFFDAPTAVGVARADVFADALTGGVHIGRIGGPMLVTPSAALHGDIEGYLCSNADTIATAYVYGGVVAVSQATEDAVADRITGQGC